MKTFEIDKEEMDKWLDSKDLKDGFFTVEHDTNRQYYNNYPDDKVFYESIIADYYIWIKELEMGALTDISEDYSYFDYLLNNEYIIFKDSLTLATFEWIKSEEIEEEIEEEFNDVDTISNYLYEKYLNQAGDYPIREYSRIRKSEIMENFEKFWTYNWGYFNAKAPLKAQEEFMMDIIMQLKMNWLLEDDEDEFILSNYADEENWGLEAIAEHLKANGSKLSYT